MWRQVDKIKIVRLRLEEGMSPKALGKMFGVNPNLVGVWCRQYKEYGADRLKSQNGVKRASKKL